MPSGGARKNAGRKKGVPSKQTAAVKEALLNAFEKAGGELYLAKIAKSDPKTFCMLVAKLIPTEVSASIDGELKATITETKEFRPSKPKADKK